MSLLETLFLYTAPDPRIWIVALVVGLPFALVLGWAARKFKLSHAPLIYLTILVLSACAYFWLVVTFVHSDGEHAVIGGARMTLHASQFMAAQKATDLEVIGAFDGWSNPDAVWERDSRACVYVFIALLASLVAGAFMALVTRFWGSFKRLLSR